MPNATKVYMLWHSRDLGDGDTDDKLIGVYATHADAERAQQRTVLLKGFRNVPDGFVIDPYEIGKDHWSSGYSTYITGPDGVRFIDEDPPASGSDSEPE